VYQVGDQPRLYYIARSTNHQKLYIFVQILILPKRILINELQTVCVMSIQKITQIEKYLKFKMITERIKFYDISCPNNVVLQKLGFLRYGPASFG
jgi:hypothetical protein